MEDALLNELKIKIIDTLNLIDITPDNFEPDAPLVGGELGIDSIDILELVMMLEQDYGIKIDSKELGAKVFGSLNALCNYVRENTAAIAN